MSKKTASRTGIWSEKIIKSRTKNGKWHKAMLQGRIEAKANPSFMQQVRSSKNMRQVDLAQLLKIKAPTLAAIERGKRPVKRDVAFLIARTLSVSPSKLFRQEGKKFVAVIQKIAI